MNYKLTAIIVVAMLSIATVSSFAATSATVDTTPAKIKQTQSATPQEVIEKIHKAAEFLKEKGPLALTVLRDSKSEYTWKDTYIYIIDVERNLVLSNPIFKEREGGKIRDHLDYAGKKYGIELCDLANVGGGWFETTWAKPNDKKLYRKINYIYPVPGTRYTLGAGIYNDTMTVDELNKLSGQYLAEFAKKQQQLAEIIAKRNIVTVSKEQLEAAKDKVDVNSATAREIIEKVHKAAEFLKEKGPLALTVLRDPKSEYTWKDTYIYIIDTERSIVLSNPVFKEREGGDIREHLDYAGKKYGIELCDLANAGGGWFETTWAKPNDKKLYRKINYIYPVPGFRYTLGVGIYNDTMSVEELNDLTKVVRENIKK